MSYQKSLGIAVLAVFLASVLVGLPIGAQVSSTSNGTSIAANVGYLSPGQVVLIAITDPGLVSTFKVVSNGAVNTIGLTKAAEYILNNTVIQGSTSETLYSLVSGNSSYVLFIKGTNTFWIFLTNTTTGNNQGIDGLYLNIVSNSVGTFLYNAIGYDYGNPYLLYISGLYYYELPNTIGPVLYNNRSSSNIPAGSNVGVVNVASIAQKQSINILYSPIEGGTDEITLSYFTSESVSLTSSQSTVPLNSVWVGTVKDPGALIDPLRGNTYFLATQGTFENHLDFFTENISYPGVIYGTNVAVNVSASMALPSSDNSLFGIIPALNENVYNGSFQIYLSSVPTNPNYATLGTTGLGYQARLPSYVSAQQYDYLIENHLFGQFTPISITVTDALQESASASVTGAIMPSKMAVSSVSTKTSGAVTLNAFDNISNFSASISLPVYVSVVYTSNGSAVHTSNGLVLANIPITLAETSAGSGVFNETLTVNIGSSPSVSQTSSGTIVVTLTPSELSKVQIRATAYTDFGNYFYFGYLTNETSASTPITIFGTKLTPVLPTVTTVSNSTSVYEVNYSEPNLPNNVNSETLLNVNGEELLYNRIQVANFVVIVTVPGRSPVTLNLNQFGYLYLVSSNDVFTVTISESQLLSALRSALGIRNLPSGTTVEFGVNDLISPVPANITYSLTTVPVKTLVTVPTSSTPSSSGTAYLPSVVGSSDTHTISVLVQDTAYAATNPASVLSPTASLYLKLANGLYYIFPTGKDSTSLSLTETAPNSGNFTGTVTYYYNGNDIVINGFSIPANEMVGAILTVSYTSPSSHTSSNATVTFSAASMTISTSVTSANPGSPLNVTVNAPGLIKSKTSNFTTSNVLFVNFTAWNGMGPAGVKSVNGYSLRLSEMAPGSPYFTAMVYLGNTSASPVAGINSLTSGLSGYTVAPGTTVYFYSVNSLSTLSTASGVVVNYHPATVSVNTVAPKVSIVNPSPSSPFATLNVSVTYPLFSLFSNMPPVGSTGSLSSVSALSDLLAYVQAANSGQLLKFPSSFSYYYENSTTFYVTIPMTLWSGSPGEYTPGHLNVNATDSVTVTNYVYSFSQVVVANQGIVSSVASLSLSTGSPLTINAIVPPAIEEMYGTTNITESSINVAPFPNTTVGILVNITVYAPDAVLNPNVGSNGRNFDVTITNPATHVTTTLTVAEIRNSPYYTGELRVVPAADYSSYAGQRGVISVASGQVNKISVVVDVTTGIAYVNNVQTQFTMTGSSYFYVGSVVAKPTIISSQVVSVSTGQPVTTLTPGQSYEITFPVKNTGNVNATVYAIIEIEVNGTVVTSPAIVITTLSPGQISSIGTVWTPVAAGTYNVTIILYQNPELSIPYVPGTETLTLTVS